MNISKAEISEILNLRTNSSIGQELADRQLEAIAKGFAFLSSKENNVLYIADEVGLGKTYIAIGILTLFRHFSKKSSSLTDLIIVPKSNLQTKWEKDILNFISNNYKGESKQVNDIKENVFIRDRIYPLDTRGQIAINRMTSFSGITMKKSSQKQLYDYLTTSVFKKEDIEAQRILWKAYRDIGWFNKGNERKLRNLVAYLLNICSEKLNCVVIDEAHNYKYGPGIDDHQESIRNETTSRFLGAIKDQEIFNEFQELEKQIKFPLAENIICLSATPKDRDLSEIKKQLSCFTNKHVLSSAKDSDEIEKRLKTFLIRGNLEYILNNERYSRNKCVEEHRKGNVAKLFKDTLVIEDSIESVFWQLIQYQSIKHLNQKNNATFEIGMLAGFETYSTDIVRRKAAKENEPQNDDDTKEYEQVEHRSKRESQDKEVVKSIVESYKKAFDATPPHPKQSKLIAEIIRQLQIQEKSLVFSRRVATVYEIEKSLTHEFEKEIIVGKQLKYVLDNKKYSSDAIKNLVADYSQKDTIEQLDEKLNTLSSKNEVNRYLVTENLSETDFTTRLKFAFNHNKIFKAKFSLYIQKGLSNVSSELKSIAIEALKSTKEDYLNSDDKIVLDEDDGHGKSGFYFLDYFKKDNVGFKHRQRIYREDWFHINILGLNERFAFLSTNDKQLKEFLLSRQSTDEKQKETSKQKFERNHNLVCDYLKENGSLCSKHEKTNLQTYNKELPETFLTKLLCELVSIEMQDWIDKRRSLTMHNFIKDLNVLQSILINIFRNGAGLLLSYIVDQSQTNFKIGMLDLLSKEGSTFLFLKEEIKTIIKDFDLIVQLNFDKKEEGRINQVLRNLTPIVALTGQDKVDKGIIAARFRMPGYPYVLITTDIFREGEDLHTYCQNVYHYGLAWNPSDMQQRTGRIDRINSLSYRKLNQTQALDFDNKVHVFYPYLRNSVEVNQVVLLFKNVNNFIETFNEIGKINQYETYVNTQEAISEEDIPEQIQEHLSSKYDVKDFDPGKLK